MLSIKYYLPITDSEWLGGWPVYKGAFLFDWIYYYIPFSDTLQLKHCKKHNAFQNGVVSYWVGSTSIIILLGGDAVWTGGSTPNALIAY